MTGPNPKPTPRPSPQPSRRARRRQAVRPSVPVPLISVLFFLYLLAGLLLSAPQPPFWTWIIAAIAIPLLTIGLTQPIAPSPTSARLRPFTYLGGLLLVVALSIALNYVGSDQSFDDTGFFSALLILATLTLLAVGLTASTAIFSSLAGERLLQTKAYKSSLSVLLGTAFCGIVAGGLIGFAAVTLTTSA